MCHPGKIKTNCLCPKNTAKREASDMWVIKNTNTSFINSSPKNTGGYLKYHKNFYEKVGVWPYFSSLIHRLSAYGPLMIFFPMGAHIFQIYFMDVFLSYSHIGRYLFSHPSFFLSLENIKKSFLNMGIFWGGRGKLANIGGDEG